MEITQKEKWELQERNTTKKGVSTHKKTHPDLTGTEDKENNTRKYWINFNEHMRKENFEIKINHLANREKTEINRLINEYECIFAKDKYDIGTVKEYEAHIDLLVDRYCSKRPYRCTVENKKEIEEQISR